MRKLVSVIIAVIVTGIIVVCVPWLSQNESNHTTADTEVSDSPCIEVDNPDRLAFWFPRYDSINHGLVDIAEELWRIDSAAANENDIDRENWYSKCQNILIHGFDSIHQDTNLTNYQKADSMLAEVEVFFEKDADLSTKGMIINFDLQNSFLIYRMTALSKQVLNEFPSFAKEIEAWNDLEKSMYEFCLGVVNLDWFGGSGAGPATLAQRNSIVQCRIDDLKRIVRLSLGISTHKSQNVNHILSASKRRFNNAIDRTATSVSSVDEAKEYLPEDRIEDYASLYIKVQESKKPLKDAFEKWSYVRYHAFKGSVLKSEEKLIMNNDAITIDALSKCVACAENER